MSDLTTTTAPSAAPPAGGARVAPPGPSRGRSTLLRLLPAVALIAVLAVFPIFVGGFWLTIGFSVFAAVIGAVGLNLLVGTTGQLSLAHAFFLAVGAVTYVYVSGSPGGVSTEYGGLELPPLVGLIAGVLAAGLAGLLVSPITARLHGIYLGIATLGLVFIGVYLLNTVSYVTGGFNGRLVPDFELFGFNFGANEGPYLEVAGVPFGRNERLWYLGLVLCVLACWFAVNLLRSRPGRALQMVRDSETAGSVLGINVQEYKAKVFLVSSMYAGLAGVLYALSIGSIAPESFRLPLSVFYLAMVVLGGLGSVWGAVLGATFVTALPLVFQEYAAALPFIVEPGQSGGIIAPQAASFLFGIAIILVVIFEPGGLAGLARKLRRLTPSRPSRGSGPGRRSARAEIPTSASADSSTGGTLS
ncbi:branched-chain amino acid ABC transporter permease [Nocardioides sp.]|uniref:branched-chain amino acid ABC transporter permease n=1 Tax=Nocardioides sp. TaxID=35761 RepID=UPI003514AF0B